MKFAIKYKNSVWLSLRIDGFTRGKCIRFFTLDIHRQKD